MKADGSVLIDTKIMTGGMEKGFELIKDEMSSVGVTAKQVGKQIELSFSKMDVSKPIANAVAKVEQLERQLSSISSEYRSAVSEGDDKEAERLAAKRIAIYDRLEAAREKLSIELAHAVQKEAAAEEKASQKAIRAAEKEAAAKKKIVEKQLRDLEKPAKRFGSRLREIATGALFFNLISRGLGNLTSYFGSALKANQEYTNSLAVLKGSLMTAFQPVYEAVLPAIITLINWLNVAVQVVGRFFAAIAGKSYTQMQKNANALNKQADAIGNVGDSAKEAAKQLAAFDEINRLESVESASSGGASGGIGPIFDEAGIPDAWETEIESLAMRVKDIFFTWDNLNEEIIAEKLVTALSMITGALIGFALGGTTGALIGISVGAALGVILSDILFDGDGKLSEEEFMKTLITALGAITGGAVGFAVGGPVGAAIGLTIGAALGVKLSDIMFDGDGAITSDELIKSLVSGLSIIAGSLIGFAVGGPAGAVIGATLGIALAFTIQNTVFDEIVSSVQRAFSDISNYAAETFSNGFINGVGILLADAWNWMTEMFWSFVESLIANWNSIWSGINQYQTTGTIGPQAYSAASAFSVYSRTPEIPQLAKGAVIPPNKKFMAVLGDQTHGTNLEAPEDLIRQIVREETGRDDRLVQLMEMLISVVEEIEIGDETIGRAAERYTRKTARARGV